MPNLIFERDQLCAEVPEGTDVMSWVDELGASVSFGCRSGMCGTCVVTILEGAAHLPAASREEKETLEMAGARPDQRLACQLKIFGDVKIVQEAPL